LRKLRITAGNVMLQPANVKCRFTWRYAPAIGPDCPFPWNRVPVDHILSVPGHSDDDRIAILGGAAAKLLGIN
jgi:hypothetical protein